MESSSSSQKVFCDARGYFFVSFSERDFNEAMTPIHGHGIKFVQDNVCPLMA